MVHTRQLGVHKNKLYLFVYTEQNKHLITMDVSEEGKITAHVPADTKIHIKKIPKEHEDNHAECHQRSIEEKERGK